MPFRRSRGTFKSDLLASLLAGLYLLGGATRASADAILFQDNFDSDSSLSAAGWVSTSSGGNGGGSANLDIGDLFSPGQYGGRAVYAIEADINFRGSMGLGVITLDHSVGTTAVAGATYALSLDAGLFVGNSADQAPNVNYGVQVWAGTPGASGSTPLWEIAVNGAPQLEFPVAPGNWATWTGSFIAAADTPAAPLYLRLFSIDNGGHQNQDLIAWDNVSIATTPLPSSAGGGLALLILVAFSKAVRRRKIVTSGLPKS